VLRPLSGHPGTVRALADRLAAQGEHLLSVAEALVGLSGPDVAWESPSGQAFAARSRPAASLLAAVGRRHGVSAAALRPFAAALEHAQAVVDAAVAEHSDAWPRAVALGNARVEAEQAADPAQRARAAGLHVQEVAELERVQDAERRHAEAWCAFDEADRRCAGVLRQLVEDGLADPRTYDALTGLSRVASGVEGAAGAVALVPTAASTAFGLVAATAGGVKLLTDTTVKVTYGDGDWASLGLSGAAAATGPAARGLKVGALATNPAARSAATRAERRGLRYGLGERLKVGAVAELRGFGRSVAKPPAKVFTPTARPRSPVAMAHWAAEQALERARHAARVKWLDDLAVATRDPARSRTMLVAGYGTGAASTVLDGAAAVRDVQLGHREREAMQLRDERAEPDGSGETAGPRRPR
jgi:hypothetical protein